MLMTSQEFLQLCGYLQSSEGCNFRKTGDGPADISWDCDNKLTLTTAWLKQYGLTIEDNVKALQEAGGYCDCEVLLNATENWGG